MTSRHRNLSALLSILILTVTVLVAGLDPALVRADTIRPVPAASEPLFALGLLNPYITEPSTSQVFADSEVEDQQLLDQKFLLHAQIREEERTHAQNEDARRMLASRSMQLSSLVTVQKLKRGRLVADSAQHFLGSRYVWGGTGPQGFDCSGFTQYVMKQHGVEVPRNSYEQFEVGQAVAREQLQPGDLVFFSTYAPGPSHLGIYIGDGKFVHALNQQTGVTTSELDADYYRERFLGAKRVL